MVAAAGCGVVVPPGDGEALAAALRSLADDPERARALGIAGRAYAERMLDWKAIVASWLEQLHGSARSAGRWR